MKVVVAGGGTAGHVNPALALAAELAGEVVFFGTASGAEARLVPAAGFPLRYVAIRGFDRSRPQTLPLVAGRAAAAVWNTRRDLERERADVVVGMGGYVSLPLCMAAATLRVPVVLHEQNIVLGLANRVCKPLARSVAVSFAETLAQAGRRGVYVGNPVRAEVRRFDRATARRRGLSRFELEEGRKTLLVFGGSQGAESLNRAAIGLLREWRGRDDIQVLHIAGPAHRDRYAAEVADSKSNLLYRVVDFVDPMTDAFGVADLTVCRGGATTVAELGVIGLPAIVVPYPYHRDRQQELHARALERLGGALVVPDRELTPERLAAAVTILDDAEMLGTMREAMRRFGRPDAAEALAEVVEGAAG